ncbi:Acriflavine sensitivity control protein acr-like protein [Hapsidospora chrysogenum ATCC 11550]|uniref:Acriflavine sensitivity control protein acr-like protein n=1 Tax=Hapsidospora chrysogenum (strain ATCC 11550 / CBS 779.69 / DSM 880 / IAM 14645 / JCM 23072 / IMI 49137) TaxID=857340 RepID=A0A086SYH2_HAPC1|nr:Acriflavine sensitivity control protein acr-like protein [Hapsidospora chrysogenum ATCC 11550]
MARRKRPYVPKIKGCYECSQRRIDCDRTGPSCNKCSSRGLSCSGFGVKYRFRNGFAPGRKTPTSKSRSSNPYASTTSQASPESASVSPSSVDSEGGGGGGGQTYGWYTDGHDTDGHDGRGPGAGLSSVSVGFGSHVLSHPHLPGAGEVGTTTTATTTTYGVNMFDHHRTQDGSSPASYSSDMILEAFIETGGSLLSFAPQEPEEPHCDTHEAGCHEATAVYEEPSRPHGDDRDVFDIIAEYASILGSEETAPSPPSHGPGEKPEMGSTNTEVLPSQPPATVPTAAHWYAPVSPAAGLGQISPSKQFLLNHCKARP